MIDYSTVRSGLRAVLRTVDNDDLPDESNTSVENRAFTPAIGVPWLRETLITGDERRVASDEIQAVGIMQYDLFWPNGDGTERVEKLADDIKNTFRPDTTVSTHAYVYRAERFGGRNDDKWYNISIRLTFRIFAFTSIGTCGVP